MKHLDDIEARLKAATPGPWRLWQDDATRRGSAVETAWSHDTEGADTELITDWCSPTDADLIAHAPDDLTRLVKALKAVDEQLRWAEASKTQWTSAPALREKITEALQGEQ